MPDQTKVVGSIKPRPAEPKIEADGIVVPLADFPGEWIKFKRDWYFGDVDSVGSFIAGTHFAMVNTLKLVVDWKITDAKHSEIAFVKEAFVVPPELEGKKAPDLTALNFLSKEKAAAITNAAFLAYNASGRPDPLAS